MRLRRVRNFRYSSWLLLLAVVVLVVYRLSVAPHAAPKSPERLEEGTYRLQRVVDGDTLLLDNAARVRLIGVDTPETVKPNHPVEPFGPEASTFTKRFTASGKVRLQFDGQRRDRYDRYLAFVWVDGKLLNEELVRAGLGLAEPEYHYSEAMKRRLLKAEREAQAAERGIWSTPNEDGVRARHHRAREKKGAALAPA